MRKIVAITFFFSCSVLSLIGQSDFSEFRFGFQVSPTITWMSSSDNQINANGSLLGSKLGMVGENYFAENYALIFGIGFAFNQGGTLKHDIGGNLWSESKLSSDIYQKGAALPDGVNLKYSLQYVELPIGLKMRTQEFGYMRYWAEIPVFTLGILTQAKGAIIGTDMDTEKEDIQKDINFMALSWGFGLGAEYSIGPSTALVAGIYYQNYFTDVSKNKGQKYPERDGNGEPVAGTEVTNDGKDAPQGITIRIGVMF